MSERLDHEKLTKIKELRNSGMGTSAKDVDWLIEQMETGFELATKDILRLHHEKQQLESENERLWEVVQELEKQTKNLRKQLKLIGKDTFYEGDDVSVLHVIRKRAEKALRGDNN